MTSKFNLNSALHKKQFELIIAGQKRLDIIKPATINDGISLVDNQKEYLENHQKAVASGRVMKFVPASGAATRMAKNLLSISKRISSVEDLKSLVQQGNSDAIYTLNFIEGIKKFSFCDDLEKILSENELSIDLLLERKDFKTLFEYVLSPKGLNLAMLPKALLHFHKYENENRTALDEQILETINVFSDSNSKATLHLTIQESYRDAFLSALKELRDKYDINVEYSVQDPDSNSIALDENNELVVNNGNLILHPSGHGALLANLNNINGDIIHIKNIDNVPRSDKDTKSDIYKKLLTGFLIKKQKEIFYFADLLEKSEPSREFNSLVENYLKDDLNIIIKDVYENYSEKLKKEYFIKILNRPIRVCGMIRNTGESGGGPFWVKNSEGNITLQIIEQSQILEEQRNLLEEATHFNPVDMVCAVRDRFDKNFDLLKYRDENAYLIPKKSINGDSIRIFEQPGLWNGGMAHWNTFFIEVPNSTFAPVKEVNDLLKDEHQPK